MNNPSGLKPVGRAVLVKPYKVEEKIGSIIIPTSVQEKDQLAEQRAVVIQVGPTAWAGEPEPRALPGDKIYFSKWAGYNTVGPADGELYRVVNDSDIFMVITEEKS